jgi:hypothetical protein
MNKIKPKNFKCLASQQTCFCCGTVILKNARVCKTCYGYHQIRGFIDSAKKLFVEVENG